MKNWLLKLSKKRSRQGLYEFLEREFTGIRQGEEVITIGSGGQINTLLNTHADRQGFDVVSFDIDEDRNPDITGDICTYDFGGRKFDTVVICEVLEHLHSPHLGINTIHSILKPGGRMILTTPFILPIHDRPYDYFRFTRFGLEHLLSEFSDVDIRERNSYFETIDVLWMRLMHTGSYRARWLSYMVIPVVFFLKRPFTVLMSKLIKTDAMTTGYSVTAVKRAG